MTVAVRGEVAEVLRAEAQAVLAMVLDEGRRGTLADVIAAVDDGELDEADAAAAEQLLELGLVNGRIRALVRAGGRAGHRVASPPPPARARRHRVGA